MSNIHSKSVSTAADTIRLDSLSIVPNTLYLRGISGYSVDTGTYDFYPFASLLVWKQKPKGDSIFATFRVYPFAFANRYFNKDHSLYERSNRLKTVSPFVYVPNEVSPDKLVDFGALDYNGNLSRSVGFGSTQSVTLNSSFNLQLKGMLTKDLEVTAAITDNNIPIQPEGNTQTLQQFDKIFIQLRKGDHTVIVGDFDMNSPFDYFLHYTKKAQGGGYNGKFGFKKYGAIKAHLAAGISKGRFASNQLAVSEGNQGPYKLTGTNGETFLVILANSEGVYINGERMTRGANQDYVIDYNAGTITFMPRRIITSDLRIIVEFEYSEQSYQRTQADARIEYDSKKLNTFFDFYTEQDSKNQSVNQSLSPQQQRFLASLGDSVQKAFYSGADTVAFDVNRVLYMRYDTVYTVNGQAVHDTVFTYSTDSTKAIYAVSFSLVGEGQGNYVLAQNNANGSVYSYSPKQVIGTSPNQQLLSTGSYMPVVKLVAPQLHQMYTAGASYAIDKHNKVNAEVAMSNNDVNLFSSFGKNNNLGAAAKVGYSSEVILRNDSGKASQKLNLDFGYEFTQSTFVPIERFRNVEFARDFNLFTTGRESYNQHLASFSATYNLLKLGSITYRFRTLLMDTVYKGFENDITAKLGRKRWNMNFFTSYLHTESQTANSDFIRPSGDLFYVLSARKGLKTGFSFDHEFNIYRDRYTDTLTSVSHIWQNYHCYFGSTDTTKRQFLVDYALRTQEAAGTNAFKAVDRFANTLSFSGNMVPAKDQALRWNLTYRNIMESDTSVASQELKNYYLGRIDYSFNLFKGLIKSSTLYDIGAGREQKTQLVYLVSPNNTGNYVYIGNPALPKQLSGFVPLTYVSDTSYVRTFTTTPDFYAVNTSTLNEVLNLNPANLLHKTKGFRQFLSRLSITSSLQLTKKIYAGKDVSIGNYFNPFPTNRQDTNIVSLNMNSRNSLYINRLDPKINGQLDFNYTRGRTLLTAGLENKLNRTIGPTIRWNIYKQLNLQTSYTNGLKASEADYDLTEAYRIVTNETTSELSYLFKQQLRVAASYYYGFKSNKEPQYGGQFAVINTVSLSCKYNRHNKTTLSGKVSYSAIGYGDEAYQNAQAQYAMMEGLNKGNNLVWNASFEQRLTTAIQMVITYDGRLSQGSKAVNTARAEVRAIF